MPLLLPLLSLCPPCSVRLCARRACAEFAEAGEFRVQPFGSFVSGLSTWDSDVDIVITGLVDPSPITGGFTQADKRMVAKCLDRIARELRR
jgi:hypothetical protein